MFSADKKVFYLHIHKEKELKIKMFPKTQDTIP